MFEPSDKPLEEREFPDEADLAESERQDADGKFFFCRACGEPVYEEAPRCPHCGQWVSGAAGGWRASRKWHVRVGTYLLKFILVNWLVGLAVGLLAAVAALMRWP